MRIALFQPVIPQNVGACIRLSACFRVPLDVIEPTGFTFDDRAMKRAALDYGPLGHLVRHQDWAAFQRDRPGGRLVLFTTRGATALNSFAFRADDVLLFGSETSGATEEVHSSAGARVVIPLQPGARSLNLAVSAGIGLFEGLRQTGGLASPAEL
ncbi:MAG: tRNA (cytidine(34)-2'-O)-methyltransferase [Caulobacter sp.]|nr:tRNA (cytidine(34)-2'-O)-methyltransferase [Caulobacter sp.]